MIVVVQVGSAELARATVAFDIGWAALGRGTIAAGTWRLHDYGLVRSQFHAAGLRRKLRQLAIGVLHPEPPTLPRRAAEDAPGRQPEPFAYAVELAGVADGPHDAPQAHAATEPPCTARVGHQRVFLHVQRIFHLDRLHRQVGGVGDVHLHAVLAVAVAAPAH